MEKKRKKVSDKAGPAVERKASDAFKPNPAAKPVQVQMQPQPRPVPKAQPVMNEKDKAIMDDVEHIIWNPDRLKKLNGAKAS